MGKDDGLLQEKSKDLIVSVPSFSVGARPLLKAGRVPRPFISHKAFPLVISRRQR
jgi:hypothetical protein